MPAVLKRIEEARAQGLDVSADQYPWTASSNGLDASLPPWVREGGTGEAGRAPRRTPRSRARVARRLPEAEPRLEGRRRRAHPDHERPRPRRSRSYEGKTIEAIAKQRGQGPARRADRHRDRRRREHRPRHLHHGRGRRARGAAPPAGVDVHRLGRARRGRHPLAGDARTRARGARPRASSATTCARRSCSPLEEAVRKMTSLPASRMRLADRGILRPGHGRRPRRLRPRARSASARRYEDPIHYSEGIPYVAVNGQLVVDGGRITDARPGRPLLGPGAARRALR